MTDQPFGMGDPVVRISTGEWATVAGVFTRAGDIQTYYALMPQGSSARTARTAGGSA